MYLPASEVLYVLASEATDKQDNVAFMDWILLAQWDIDHIIIDLDKIFNDS